MSDWREQLVVETLRDSTYQKIAPGGLVQGLNRSGTGKEDVNPRTSSPQSRDEGVSRRRLTAASLKALDGVTLLENEINDLVLELNDMLKIVKSPISAVPDLLKVKSSCHQFGGRLEKFQYVKVDAVVTAGLTTGKDEARARRKKLNKMCESLRISLHEVLELVEERVGKMNKEEGEGCLSVDDMVKRSKADEVKEEIKASKFEDREHGWLDSLPEASESMHLGDKSKLKMKESGLFKGSDTKKRDRALSSRGRLGSVESYTDEYHHSDDEGGNELDGELLRPEWDGCKTFVKLYSPDKASCRRYEVGMSNAGLKADRKVLEFLYTPSAHANSLKLCNRSLSLPELDLLGRLFSTQWHHACKLRELSLDSMRITDNHMTKLAVYLPTFTTLESLSLANNKITDAGAISLAGGINKSLTLKSLVLDGNRIKEKGTVVLAEAVGRIQNLEILSISHNKIGDYGAYALAVALTRHSPEGFDWEPEIPDQPRGCPAVYISLGRETSLRIRGNEALLETAQQLGGVISPPDIPPPAPQIGRSDSIDAPPPPPIELLQNPGKRASVIPPPPPPLGGGAKKRVTVIAPPSSLPPRQSVIPPPPITSKRVSIVRQSSRMSRIAPPPGGMRDRRSMLGSRKTKSGMMGARSGGFGGFQSMVIEEGDEDEEEEGGSHHNKVVQKIRKKSALLDNKVKLAFGGGGGIKKKPLSAKERIKQAKLARDEAERAKKLQDKCAAMWKLFKFYLIFLGRLQLIKRGNIPVSVLSCANCGISVAGIQWLMHACKFNPNIATLNLSDNKLQFESAVVLAEYLVWCDSLDELIIDGNELEDQGMQMLLQGVEGNISLSNISMDRCSLGAVSLNWLASFTRGFYIDNISLIKDSGVKSARVKVEEYVKEISEMGGLIDEEKIRELEDEEEGIHY